MVESVTRSHCDILDFDMADFYVLYPVAILPIGQ